MASIAAKLANQYFDQLKYANLEMSHYIGGENDDVLYVTTPHIESLGDDYVPPVAEIMFDDTEEWCVFIVREFYKVDPEQEYEALNMCNLLNTDLKFFRFFYCKATGYIMAETDFFFELDNVGDYIYMIIGGYVNVVEEVYPYLKDEFGG